MGSGLGNGYGVLKCRAVGSRIEGSTDSSPHYQVHVNDGQYDYRIAINVKSVVKPYDLLYLVDDNFTHPITDGLVNLDFGYHKQPSKPGELALDYIRGNLFDVTQMKPLPFNVPGRDNDLNEVIDLFIKRAIASDEAVIYAFGEPWGPENIPDKIFKFSPGRGIHNIHMNQGNSGKFSGENGVWQDGGLMIHYPSRNQWMAAFFAFQSQSFHTNDATGDPLDIPSDNPPPLDPTTPSVTAEVRIVAALANPTGADPGKESVTLINVSPTSVDLKGWALADRLKRKHTLNGIIQPGGVMTVRLSGTDIQLSNDGGIITLLNKEGLKIDGVSYTKADATQQGWTIVF
ncbi:MAG TPA: DUF2278 family protein [Cyanophyceae cyanobacterium]